MLADVGLGKGRYVTQRHIPSADVSDPEPRHHLIQLRGQTRKLMTGRADLMATFKASKLVCSAIERITRRTRSRKSLNLLV